GDANGRSCVDLRRPARDGLAAGGRRRDVARVGTVRRGPHRAAGDRGSPGRRSPPLRARRSHEEPRGGLPLRAAPPPRLRRGLGQPAGIGPAQRGAARGDRGGRHRDLVADVLCAEDLRHRVDDRQEPQAVPDRHRSAARGSRRDRRAGHRRL
ncbi:MAG: hypothetical protein AVDCRST_MAG38-2607, partial [uncultured Solirubrobacteraceae bacterium]